MGKKKKKYLYPPELHLSKRCQDPDNFHVVYKAGKKPKNLDGRELIDIFILDTNDPEFTFDPDSLHHNCTSPRVMTQRKRDLRGGPPFWIQAIYKQ